MLPSLSLSLHPQKAMHFLLSPPSSLLPLFTQRTKPKTLHLHRYLIMSLSSMPTSRPAGRHQPAVDEVPCLTADEVGKAADEAFKRHSSPHLKRASAGVAIMWFRNDLRVLDNEALLRAWAASAAVLPVYCVDPRNFETTHYFGFPKTGGN